MKLARRLVAASFAAALTLWAAAPAGAASLFDPAIEWKTIVTPHFRVNFAAENESVARLAASYAEEAHAILAPWLKSVPANRTELTLVDHEDTVNGYGFPLPNNQIFIYLSNPVADQHMGRYDSWLRDLLIHEYTHVLHMEKTEGLPALVNQVFGRSYFPNMIQPIFLIEGLAVHTETRWSHGGRGRGAAYRMYLRMAALEEKLAGIDLASGYYAIDHPGGEIPYVYGMAFYRHLAARYGADTPAKLAHLHAENPYVSLWGLDDETRALTGKSMGALWDEMTDALEVDARAQRARILARGPLTPLTLVTQAGMHHRHPRFMPDGELLWAAWTGHGYAYLMGDDRHPLKAQASPSAPPKGPRPPRRPAVLSGPVAPLASPAPAPARSGAGAGPPSPAPSPSATPPVAGVESATATAGPDAAGERQGVPPSASPGPGGSPAPGASPAGGAAAAAPKAPVPRRIITKGPFGSWDVSRDGRYVYHQRNWDENRFTSFDDAFRWDLKEKRIHRLSKRARLDGPAVSADGRWLVAVRNGGGQTNLVKMRADGTGLTPLTQLADRTQFSQPAWHPRRHELVVSAWRDGGRDLYRVDPETGALTAFWRDRAEDQDPTWSPDGRYVVFSSDRDEVGVYNLYAYEVARKRLFRMTNVLGGLVEPAVSPDGKTVACASYGTKGWDIATLPWDPKAWTPVPLPVAEAGMRQPAPAGPPLASWRVADYDPWPSLRPKTWAPFGFQDERGPVVGFQTFGQDTLFRHYVFGAFGLGLATGRPFYSLGYSNEVLFPSLYAYASDSTLLSAPFHENVPYWVVQRGLYQGLSATFPGLPSIFLQNTAVSGDNLTLAFAAQHIQDVNPQEVASFNLPADVRPRTGQTNTVSVTYKYGDNFRFAYGISPEGGNLVALGYEKAMPALGSQYAFDRVFFDWRRYVALPWQHHALAWRLMGGTNVGGREAGSFFLGGSDSATLLSNADLRTIGGVGTRFLPLRGYGYAAQAGPSAAAASLEWRFPLYAVQRGYGIYPAFIRNLHGAVFAEAGHAWKNAPEWGRGLADVGCELRAQTHLQQAPTAVRVGIGQGLVATGRGLQWPAVFFELGTFF